MSRGEPSRMALQAVVSVLGVIAVVAGTATVLLGVESVAGGGRASPSLDSELRFYAAWYVAAGILLLTAVPRIETAGLLIRVVALALLLAASARALSWATVGRPHTVAIVLMAIEFAIPIVLVPWQLRVARRTGTS